MENILGLSGWLSRLNIDFSSGHDLEVCEFEPHIGLCADSSEPGAYLGFRISFFLCPSSTHALFLSVS